MPAPDPEEEPGGCRSAHEELVRGKAEDDRACAHQHELDGYGQGGVHDQYSHHDHGNLVEQIHGEGRLGQP